MKTPKPSRRERTALLRLGIIGDLLSQELSRGQLEEELQKRADKRYRPPGAGRSRQYHYKTLQRWYYDAKADLASGLVPKSRARGFALKLDREQRELLLDIRPRLVTVLWAIAIAVLGLFGYGLTGGFLGIVLGVAVAAALPKLLLGLLRRHRRNRLETQLVGGIQTLAAGPCP